MKSYDKYKNPSAVWAGYVFPSRYTANIAKKNTARPVKGLAVYTG